MYEDDYFKKSDKYYSELKKAKTCRIVRALVLGHLWFLSSILYSASCTITIFSQLIQRLDQLPLLSVYLASAPNPRRILIRCILHLWRLNPCMFDTGYRI